MDRGYYVLFFLLGVINMAGQTYNCKFEFSGLKWIEKKSVDEKVGPGMNFFGLSNKNVKLNRKNELQLRIKKTKGNWSSAEVYCPEDASYGMYEFYIKNNLRRLDRSAVVGLFLFNESVPPFFNEVDIEFSTWNDEVKTNTQFVVHTDSLQPWTERFYSSQDEKYTMHRIYYDRHQILFESYYCNSDYSDPKLYHSKTFQSEDNISNHPEVFIRINYWLVNGAKRGNRRQKITVSKVNYIPLD